MQTQFDAKFCVVIIVVVDVNFSSIQIVFEESLEDHLDTVIAVQKSLLYTIYFVNVENLKRTVLFNDNIIPHD